MRLPGTCSRYSNSAMPQLTSAADVPGLVAQVLQVAVPREGHEDVRRREQQHGLDGRGQAFIAAVYRPAVRRRRKQLGNRAAPGDDELRRELGQRRAARTRARAAAGAARSASASRCCCSPYSSRSRSSVRGALRYGRSRPCAVRCDCSCASSSCARERGAQPRDGVQVVGAARIDRRAAIDDERCTSSLSRQRCERVERRGQRRARVAEVGAEPDVGVDGARRVNRRSRHRRADGTVRALRRSRPGACVRMQREHLLGRVDEERRAGRAAPAVRADRARLGVLAARRHHRNAEPEAVAGRHACRASSGSAPR